MNKKWDGFIAGMLTMMLVLVLTGAGQQLHDINKAIGVCKKEYVECVAIAVPVGVEQ